MNRVMERQPYLCYWGKARPREGASPYYHLLAYHCLDVAAVGKVLLERHPPLRDQIELTFKRNAGFVLASLPFFLALHDIGKFADSFQNLRRDLLENLQGRKSGRPYTLRHDVLGRLLWDERLDQEINRLTGWPDGEWRRFWINAVTGHHGAPPNPDGLLSDHFTRPDVAAALSFVLDTAAVLLSDVQPPDPASFDEASIRASWLLSGFSVLCDWLGSDVRWFPYEDKPCSLENYWHCALEKAERAAQESGVLPTASSVFTTFSELFPKIAEPSPLQRYVERISLGDGPQMFILEDITGSGKTEAALVLAHRLMAQGLADGVYMGLPTMATANQMYERLGKCYRRLFADNANPSLMLAHSARDLHEGFRASVLLASQARDQAYQADEETASQHCTTWLADHRKASLFADIGVGTIDQALLSVLHVKHHTLRLLGLSRKVLIVDEVHACDTYMAELLTRLLEFHAALGGSAILLSATLPLAMRHKFVEAFAAGAREAAPKVSFGPPLRRKAPETVMLKQNKDDYPPYPLATHLAGGRPEETPVEARQFVSRRVEVRLLHEPEDAIKWVIDISNSGRCVCWLRNSVKDALDACAELKPKLGEQVSLFHARFALADRLTIEDANANRFNQKSRAEHRRGRVLIATQVVEQSLDWDFDEMITDLAPMDLIIQRAGRVKRHARDEHGDPLPQGEQDRRGDPVLYILSPEAVDDPPADWVVKSMRNTALVYPHHGELWLTARELVRRDGWKMPEDARDLIESVFGEEASYPEKLQKSADQVEGQDSAALSLARSNLVSLDYGYDWDRTWYDDVYTPTRLGEPTVTVYLAKHIGEVVPWAQAHDHAWARSAVNVARRLIAQEIDPDAVTAVKEQLPGKGRGAVMLILEHNADGLWHGPAVDAKGRTRHWGYDNTIGLAEETEDT